MHPAQTVLGLQTETVLPCCGSPGAPAPAPAAKPESATEGGVLGYESTEGVHTVRGGRQRLFIPPLEPMQPHPVDAPSAAADLTLVLPMDAEHPTKPERGPWQTLAAAAEAACNGHALSRNARPPCTGDGRPRPARTQPSGRALSRTVGESLGPPLRGGPTFLHRFLLQRRPGPGGESRPPALGPMTIKLVRQGAPLSRM
jgi:hypothetical protein